MSDIERPTRGQWRRKFTIIVGATTEDQLQDMLVLNMIGGALYRTGKKLLGYEPPEPAISESSLESAAVNTETTIWTE